MDNKENVKSEKVKCVICGDIVVREFAIKVEDRFYCDQMACRNQASLFALTHNLGHFPPKIHQRS